MERAPAGYQRITRQWNHLYVIFVDTNVFMYAVGSAHPLREAAQQFFIVASLNRAPLCTSAEVLQELAHAYLPAGRLATFDSAVTLASSAGVEVWPLEEADVALARRLREQHPTLQARDLCHLASCRRRNVREIKTFDRALASVFGSPSVP